MGRILVTGASGNVGKYVAQYALKNDQRITVAGTHLERLKEARLARGLTQKALGDLVGVSPECSYHRGRPVGWFHSCGCG